MELARAVGVSVPGTSLAQASSMRQMGIDQHGREESYAVSTYITTKFTKIAKKKNCINADSISSTFSGPSWPGALL